ncbi:hypothetical protein [Sorangium atrum]|uniref:Uncharacterized protein n=1 Tax=Sorangium atrum TaxID=2995308 RepID=A0ABT5CI19_9BACT|nr:hypothetical protein [Sorangium aterium]MDC0684772.1 hypothetical protein [Sorangium aterium]
MRPRYFVMAGVHIIMGIPPHIIIMGIPADIIFVMASQRSFSMSIDMPSGGINLQVIPSFVISHDILHIIGMPMPIMPGIMPIMGIIGMPMPIMPGIIGMLMPIMPGIIGMLMPIMGIIGMPMPIMPGIMDAPAAISGVDIMGDIICGIMGICIAVVMGAPVVSARCFREPF